MKLRTNVKPVPFFFFTLFPLVHFPSVIFRVPYLLKWFFFSPNDHSNPANRYMDNTQMEKIGVIRRN